jgi:hypothetical protein
MSLHNAAFLKSLTTSVISHYDVVRAAIVSWYYAIYYSSKAMIAAASAADPQTHSKTAIIWQADIVNKRLAIGPFQLSLKSVIATLVESEIATLRGNNPYDLSTTPFDLASAWGAIISYLSGTADYERWRTEQRVHDSTEFKRYGFKDFRRKAAKELRDRALSREPVNFLTQAFRYRGKANYRDSIYLSYGDNRSSSMKTFITDLDTVTAKFNFMACHYIGRRTESGSWSSFATDIATNARFTHTIDLSQI